MRRQLHKETKTRRRGHWLLLAAIAFLLLPARGALALSEIKPADAAPQSEIDSVGRPPSAIPVPDAQLPESQPADDAKPADSTGENPEATTPGSATDKPIPEVLYDVSLLPEPVRRMRELIIEACKSGDPEALRNLLGTGDSATQLAIGGIDSDPIEYLKQMSGDEGGQEILAILLEIMKAGFVRLDAGTPDEMYVWPYFYAMPLDKLTAPQRVELFELITSGDYEDMKSYGAYIFYRSAIAPDGHWVYFIGGD
jgi:hypothetical protein